MGRAERKVWPCSMLLKMSTRHAGSGAPCGRTRSARSLSCVRPFRPTPWECCASRRKRQPSGGSPRCALAQHFLGDGADTQHFAEEIDGVLRACQGGQIAVDDHAVEAVVYEQEQTGKQFVEEFHQSISQPSTLSAKQDFREAPKHPAWPGATAGGRGEFPPDR